MNPPNSTPTTPGTAARPSAPSAGQPERLAWLFRRAALGGHVHPLQVLLTRYREGERG